MHSAAPTNYWTGQLFATTIGSIVVGVLVAVIAVRLSGNAQLHRFSILQLYPIQKHEQVTNRTSTFWRLPIENVGKHTCFSATAEVVEIVDRDSRRQGVIIAPLNWAHNPPNIYTKDISPNQIAYLDICQWDNSVVPPKISNPTVSSISNSSDLNVESESIGLRLFQRSGQVIEVRIGLTWVESGGGGVIESVAVTKLKGDRRRLGLFSTRNAVQTRAEAKGTLDV